MTTALSLSATLEERNAKRAELLRRLGYDPMITEEAAATIRKEVARAYVILSEDFTGFRLTFRVNARADISTRARLDIEDALLKTFGNSPYRYGSEFTGYTVNFYAN